MTEDFEPEGNEYLGDLEDPKDLMYYTAFDSIEFEGVDKNVRRRIYRFTNKHPIRQIMDVFAYTYEGILFIEFEYDILFEPVKQIQQFEQMIGFCRDLAKKFPNLESDWIYCLYEEESVFYKIHQGSLLVAAAKIQPDMKTIRKLD